MNKIPTPQDPYVSPGSEVIPAREDQTDREKAIINYYEAMLSADRLRLGDVLCIANQLLDVSEMEFAQMHKGSAVEGLHNLELLIHNFLTGPNVPVIDLY